MHEHDNVDYNEISKFNRTMEDWWSTNGPFRTLHHINACRVEFIKRFAPLEGKLLLDVGCGGGILSEGLANAGANVTGIDLAESAIQAASTHAKNSELHCQYQVCSVEELAEQQPARYDVVTCMELLEHVPSPAQIVEACAKLVKPNGWVFFSTINRTTKAYMSAIVGAEYILGLLPKKTHDFDKFIKPSELASDCRHAQLTVRQLTGVHYNPFTKITKECSSLDVNYMMATQREILSTIS